ncbi:MAG: hypothetical protein NVS2B15_06240 [Pseudarthrobacter sp.]
MSLYGRDESRDVKFVALAGTVTGYGDRGVHGTAYKSRDGYLFRDSDEESWWVIFQPSSVAVIPRAQVRGDVLACSDSHGEAIRVRPLARGVLRVDADAAFRDHTPVSYEDAVAVAVGIADRLG